MPAFNYKQAQKTAKRLLVKFGVKTKLFRVAGDFDPVAGINSNSTLQTSETVAVALPTTNGLGLTGDKQFTEDLKQGKIKGFYASAVGASFDYEPGDFILWEGSIFDVVATSKLSPAGVAVLYMLGCRASAKLPTDFPG